ncbi:Hsp33 family molecular chaperone HslO [Dehalobacterium formicoaceticum]|uniref:33 kDa chaperonin n=1 Tax=Dehalobacterium formicoaceticum TaxID=51515 RepID=A0ABT1Y0R6_9FIRM|nr:Hsp33 family molecular chaperone HslO [Dehalobacterium formicoaceticum]MCR6544447.1 Hsp33 family molecular chaperone HslO [Dehalobacterium formicoaceticum]
MSDYCIRGTGAGGGIRIWVATTTNLCEEARRRHDTYPTASAALGRLLTAGVMMGLNLKGEDILTLRVLGDGPLGAIVVVANALGEVRGYVENPHVHLPSITPGKLNVGGAVGKEGFLYVVKDLGMKEPYTGSVPLVSGEIGEDLTRYFAESEQTPSAVALGVLVNPDNTVKAAGGYIVQLMPGVSDEDITQLEKNIASVLPVSQMIDEGITPEEIGAKVLAGMDLQVLEKQPVSFQCKCSRERVQHILQGIGREELCALLEDQGCGELTCHFCGEKYLFSEAELKEMIDEADRERKEKEEKEE